MGKHRFRNRIKSMVGSLIDTDKDEELKESNIETEDNYKEIIEILNEDDLEDKEKLVGLIEKFHSRYQSLYWRYDNITGKLKEKVRSKKEKEKDSSSSSSSDSDSDDKNGSKNGKLENHIDMVTDSLKEEVEAANIEIDELKRKLAVETEEKIVLKSQVIETEEMFNELKLQSDEENSKLLAENRDLNLKLENFVVAETEMKQKIEDINRENTGLVLEREAGMKTIEELKAIIDELKRENKDFESELVGVKCEFSEMKNKLQTTEEEMSVLIQKLENAELQNKSLFIECSQLREKLFEKESELSMLKNETESKIEKMSDEKEQIVDQLEESIEDLKSDIEMKGDEINTLTETVRNLEVKIRLANQKLRVTEQMLSETEHDHTTKEEKLHQENNILMDKISTLSQTITAIKKEVKEKVNETLTGIDSLNVKFEEDYGHVTTRVCEITNEIHATQNQFKQMKEDTEKNTEEIAMKLKVSAEENASLMDSLENMKIGIAKKDEKIDELKNTILMKEEWISGFGEDKREAIKQLCIWADYHRDRYDHLHELLLKKTAGSRRQTVS